MTREEAIQVLQTALTAPFIYGNYAKALEMAIEALSAETHEIRTETHGVCLDLISRADAEAFVCMERCGEYRKDCPAQTCPIIEHLDSIPSAEPTELLKDGTLKVNVNNGAEVNRVLVWGDDGFGGLYYMDDRPSGEWIPVSERLPEDGQPVIITTDDEAFKDHPVGSCIYQNGRFQTNYKYDIKMIAWMPLPKPYCQNCGE